MEYESLEDRIKDTIWLQDNNWPWPPAVHGKIDANSPLMTAYQHAGDQYYIPVSPYVSDTDDITWSDYEPRQLYQDAGFIGPVYDWDHYDPDDI